MNSFFNSTSFYVIGASNNRSKFGNIVLRWYQDHNLNVQPVNPKETMIEGLKVIASLNEIVEPKSTSISVITPPAVTLQILKQAKELGINNIWLQPGCENVEVINWIESEGKELGGRIIFGGPCVLVIGEKLLREQLAASSSSKEGKM